MALQSIKHGFPFPAWPNTVFTSAPSLTTSNFTIDASGEKAAFIMQATAAKSIRTIYLRTGTVTTGDTVDVRVETVDSAANGDPTGTLWGTNTNGALVVDAADDNAWKSVTLTADAAVAVGDVFALVVVNGSGGGNMQWAHYSKAQNQFPYGDHYTTAWAKIAGAAPLILPAYSDGSFEPVFGHFDVGGPITATTFNSGSTTNRRGNIFQVPFPCRAAGCWLFVDADGEFTVKLYDSDGSTVLATTPTIKPFQRQANTGGGHFYTFLSTATLSKATNYRIAVVPSSVTNLTTYDFDVPSAGMLDMFPGGQSCHASVYTSGAWVETTTRRGYLGVFLDAFDDAVSAGRPFGGSLL